MDPFSHSRNSSTSSDGASSVMMDRYLNDHSNVTDRLVSHSGSAADQKSTMDKKWEEISQQINRVSDVMSKK